MQKSARKTGMPLLIPSAEFDEKLSRTSTGKNTQHTQAFIDGGSHDFYLPDYAVPPGYRLLQSSREDQYRLIKAGAEPETVYAVKLLLLDTIVPSRRSCTQIMVWRSVLPQHEEAVHGLARRFFRYFLQRYSIVVSDSEHTGDGCRFWEGMIAWALAQPEYHVYLSDGRFDDRPLRAIPNWDDFYDHWAQYGWGEDRDYHPHRLFVISHEKLE
ncbi:hypothetical protein [Erwinia aphidicola]|uniref:hypothetical protein n=1 Tax=Erwinia aphidicola TaxID=68334 RepID=UPI003BAFA695